MEGATSWITHNYDDIVREIPEFEAYPELVDEGNGDSMVASLDVIPDDILERILAHLPVVSIFRSSSVCKRWNDIVKSNKFLWNFSHVFVTHKPWYFMFTSSDEPLGYAYDPNLRKWYGIDLPCIEASTWFIASSYGLVCFMDNNTRDHLYICNPINKNYKRILEPLGKKLSDYSALAVSVDKTSHIYSVSLVKSKQIPENIGRWDLSIQVYDSETMMWLKSVNEVLSGWRGGDESVICKGVLYILIYSTAVSLGWAEKRHGLIMYKISSRYSHGMLMRNFIPVPCSLTCGRLINLNDKLVLVGGIGKYDRSDIIKGIGIWILRGKYWVEVSRMPHKFFQGFGEFDDVFASSGMDDVIYIQSYGSSALLIFDMNRRQWKWSHKCPVSKRFPLHLFTGFCFEPRMEVMP